jgi:hypothetical protein
MEQDKTKKRKSLIDRLQKFSGEEPVISKGKVNKIKEKLMEPKTIVNERFDGWGDDVEED